MKKFISTILTFALLLTSAALTGCKDDSENTNKKSGENLKIVSTIFPQYDWVKEILGERADVMGNTYLLDTKVDLHSFEPTVQDIMAVADCDLFIYVGGESDEWAEDALAKKATNPNRQVINLVEVLGEDAKIEEVVEGMEDEEHGHDEDDHDEDEDNHDEDEDNHDEDEDNHDEDEDDHDEDEDDHDESEEDHEDEEGEDHEEEIDEHVWLSLKNAEKFCNAIYDALAVLDADNKDLYKTNLDAYVAKLRDLDGQYQAAVDGAAVDTLLFADRFPFRYFADDYGLKYYAAFVGCSAETEASFETIKGLSTRVDDLKLTAVCVTETSDGKMGDTVINGTKDKNQKIVVFDAIQTVSAKEKTDGTTYLSKMEFNLNALKEALS